MCFACRKHTALAAEERVLLTTGLVGTSQPAQVCDGGVTATGTLQLLCSPSVQFPSSSQWDLH